MPNALDTETYILCKFDVTLEMMFRGTKSRLYHSKRFTAKLNSREPTIYKVTQHPAAQKTKDQEYKCLEVGSPIQRTKARLYKCSVCRKSGH